VVGVQVLLVKWSQAVARGEGRCCNISQGTEGGTVQPRSRQDEHSWCTEEDTETLETTMPLGLEQRLNCDIDILV
jgi:hypothetical protein